MIVFFDLDGTLISDDEAYIIPDSAVNAIHKAQKNGHLMYVDTGRTVMNVEQRIRDIGFDGYICGCGMYIECDGKVIYQHTLSSELCKNVAKLVFECNMTPMYEHSKSFYCAVPKDILIIDNKTHIHKIEFYFQILIH